jgi:short subunit dehydrogenase-like uncharacterized protein
MIYGATGYTGRLIAEEAARRGESPILAGRNSERVVELATELNLESRVFELKQHQECVDKLKGVKVVLNCAGPFSATSRDMLAACVETGTHYLDITGEVDVFEFIFGQSARWRQARIAVIPGVGYDIVPTDCLAALLKEKMPDAKELILGIKAFSLRPSPGTVKTLVEGLTTEGRRRLDGKLVTIPAYSLVKNIPFKDKARLAVAIPWGDISTAWHSTGIPNITVYMAMDKKNIQFMRSIRFLTPLLKSPWILRRVQDFAGKRSSGPNNEERQTGRTLIWGQVTSTTGRKITMTMATPEPYQLTIDAALKSVKLMLGTHNFTGSLTPSMAFGARFFEQITGVTVEIES